ncbi:MAG: carboxylating nicotinate-nucleotide diphosphorylase [Pseudomonadota bacterium]
MPEPIALMLPPLAVEEAVRAALAEDLGRAGDITTMATIGDEKTATAVINARDPGILSGIECAQSAFKIIDSYLSFDTDVHDGSALAADTEIATISGSARSILTAERVALNFLIRMSGIASYTAVFQKRIAHTSAKICDTRKTVPGMRMFDKYAVRCGGGANHRFGLDDAILIKDNHIAVAGGVALAIKAAQSYVGHTVKIEVEVDNLNQFDEALAAKPDIIMLDNMSTADMEDAVDRKNRSDHQPALEASGNVDLDSVKAIAETGVDLISTSKITMAAPPIDLGLDISIS